MDLYGAFEVKHLFHSILHFLPSFIPVSLFDSESRFFAPTHMCWRPARTGAVKAGRRSSAVACPWRIRNYAALAATTVIRSDPIVVFPKSK